MPDDIDATYAKYAGETQTLSINFTDALGDSEAVSSASTSVVKESDSSITTGDMIDGTSVSTPYVYPMLTGGIAGERYILTVSATTDANNVKIFKIRVSVI